jgi:hypothetical protein
MRKHCGQIGRDPGRLVDRGGLHRGDLMLAQSLAADERFFWIGTQRSMG